MDVWGTTFANFSNIDETLILNDPTAFWLDYWCSGRPGIQTNSMKNHTCKTHAKKTTFGTSFVQKVWKRGWGFYALRGPNLTFSWPCNFLVPFWSPNRFCVPFWSLFNPFLVHLLLLSGAFLVPFWCPFGKHLQDGTPKLEKGFDVTFRAQQSYTKVALAPNVESIFNMALRSWKRGLMLCFRAAGFREAYWIYIYIYIYIYIQTQK